MDLRKLSTMLIGLSAVLAIIAFYSYPLSEADVAGALPDYPSSPSFAGSTIIGAKSRVNTTISGIVADYRIVGKTPILLVDTGEGDRIRVVIPGSWIKMGMMHRGCVAEEEGIPPLELAKSIVGKRVTIHGVMVEGNNRAFMIAWGIMAFDNHFVKGYMRSDVVDKMAEIMANMGMGKCMGGHMGNMPMGGWRSSTRP